MKPFWRESKGAVLALVVFLAGSAALNYYAHRVARPPAAGKSSTGALVGKPAPDFSLAALPRADVTPATPLAPVSLAQQRGKLVLLSFWASWCRPCDYELPVLNQFYLENRARGIEVLAVGTDQERDAALAYARTHTFDFPLLWDEGGTVAKQYGVEALPTMVMVDPTGKVRVQEEGLRPDLKSWLTYETRHILKETSGARPASPASGGTGSP